MTRKAQKFYEKASDELSVIDLKQNIDELLQYIELHIGDVVVERFLRGDAVGNQ